MIHLFSRPLFRGRQTACSMGEPSQKLRRGKLVGVVSGGFGWGRRAEGKMAALEQAVAAYRETLKEFTEKAASYQHDLGQGNLGRALAVVAQHRRK